MTPLAALLALLIGVTLGLLGGGGSILTVPVFVYVLGIESKRAIAMSLPVVGLAALVGVARHARLGNVNLRIALSFGAAAMLGAYGGARLARFLLGPVQLALFALVMLAAAISMLWNARLPEEPGAERTPSWLALVPIGIGVGMVTGIVGAGGGFLIVPALVLLGRVPMRQAIGTSLLVIALNTAAGFLGYRNAVDVDWTLVTSFALVAGVGIVAGTALVRRVPTQQLKRGFAVLLIVIGTSILWQILSLL
ncbi:MAG: sulfite exporter TauE/SafE family protein [Gemmatimonadota bacterium]|nr:sulfite exporter TauE/SafE family protein [Gemmatimonadota bacterium]